MDGLNTTFPLGWPTFRGYVSFRECSSPEAMSAEASLEMFALLRRRIVGYGGIGKSAGKCFVDSISLANSNIFPTYPWNIPQTPQTKSVGRNSFHLGYVEMPGVCFRGMLRFFLTDGYLVLLMRVQSGDIIWNQK